MQINIETDGAIQHFHVAGKLDQFESALLRERLHQALESADKNIICDMGKVELINSLGIGAIAPAIRSLEKAGGKVLFYNFKAPSFRAAFEKAKVFRTFNTYEDAAHYLLGMADPLTVIIVEPTTMISDFFRSEYLKDKRKPQDFSVMTFFETNGAWERIKQLYELRKRQIVLLDTGMENIGDFTNKVKGFPIEGAKVPLILAVGSKPSFEAQGALDLADAYVQFPLNPVLFQKTFDSVASMM